jgi:hypothetical protein
LRGALAGSSHFGLFRDFTVLSIGAMFILVLGSYLFSRIQV